MKLPYYQSVIIDLIGCSEADASILENILRDTVFRSTLDWQTDPQLREGLKQAVVILGENREMYEVNAAEIKELCERERTACATS